MIKKKHFFIFDFDGTIADTLSLVIQICNQLANEFDFNKIEARDIQNFKEQSFHQTRKHLNIPYLKIPKILSQAKKEIYSNIDSIQPIDHIKEVLLTLHEKEIILGILSTNSHKNISRFLKNHNLNIFSFIKTSSKVMGKHHALKRIIKEQNLNQYNVIYFGDEIRDIISARKANIPVAAVSWGYNSTSALKKEKPDYLLTHPKDILKIIT